MTNDHRPTFSHSFLPSSWRREEKSVNSFFAVPREKGKKKKIWNREQICQWPTLTTPLFWLQPRDWLLCLNSEHVKTKGKKLGNYSRHCFKNTSYSNAIRFCVSMQYHLFSMTDADQGPITEA